MNKEIKFKIWDKENNCFWENTYEAYKGNLQELLIGLNGHLILRTLEGTIHESVFPDRFEIIRYTGFKDKKEKEIYEGYILHIKEKRGNTVSYMGTTTFNSWENEFNHIVEFSPSGLQQVAYFVQCTDCEVVGNIYEN